MHKKIKLLPIDIITYGYLLFNVLYIFIGINRIEGAGYHILFNTSIAIIVTLIIVLYQKDSRTIFYFIRYAYPLFFLGYFFNLSTIVSRVFFSDFIDPFFQQIDMLIFGYQPAIEWGARYSHILIQEIMHFAYFSYYIVIPGAAVLILFKKRKYFPKYIFTVSFVFFVCYITYSFLPVIGGRYWEELYHLTMTYRGGLFTRIMAFIYTHSQHFGAAFPSSHVAISIVVNLALFNYSVKLGRALIPLTILLTISTVYCHYHYFIDTVFGVIYAFILFRPAEKLYDLLAKNSKT